jgi:hypothetical protein
MASIVRTRSTAIRWSQSSRKFGLADEVIMSIAGHISRAMHWRYSNRKTWRPKLTWPSGFGVRLRFFESRVPRPEPNGLRVRVAREYGEGRRNPKRRGVGFSNFTRQTALAHPVPPCGRDRR